MNAYLDDNGRALKPRPAGNETTRQGPLVGRDPRALISAEEGADPAGP